MTDVAELSSLITDAGVILTAPVMRSPYEPLKHIAFIKSYINDSGIEEPASGFLSRLKNQAEALGYDIDFVKTGGVYQDIEAAVRLTAQRTLPNVIDNCYVSIEGEKVTIWIAPKQTISKEDAEVLNRKLKSYIEGLSFNIQSIIYPSSEKTPSKWACLSYIRQKSPVGAEQITRGLQDKGFSVPSHEWMSKNLDNMRKGGLVVRMKNGSYALTLDALKIMGTAKNGRSADIRRMLDIAQRGG